MLSHVLSLPLLSLTALALPVAQESYSASSFAASSALPQATGTFNVVQTNDDGWAEANIRELWSKLTAAGYNSIISAPPYDMSGSGSLEDHPHPMDKAFQCHSCLEHSGLSTGKDASRPDIHWVHGYPVTAMRYGINNLAQHRFGGPPDIALSGPNVGDSMGFGAMRDSATMWAAAAAVETGVLAIAFSGGIVDGNPWNAPVPMHSRVYAELATKVTETLLNSGAPYLPEGTLLNVNFPDPYFGKCHNIHQFRFALTRSVKHYPWVGDDVETCGKNVLPVDSDVVNRKDHCYVSISVVKASDMHTAEAEQQADVIERLGSILECVGNDHND